MTSMPSNPQEPAPFAVLKRDRRAVPRGFDRSTRTPESGTHGPAAERLFSAEAAKLRKPDPTES